VFPQKENIMTKAQNEQTTLQKKPNRREVIKASALGIAAAAASSVVACARTGSSQEETVLAQGSGSGATSKELWLS
jgi:nitrous oxide reductase